MHTLYRLTGHVTGTILDQNMYYLHPPFTYNNKYVNMSSYLLHYLIL